LAQVDLLGRDSLLPSEVSGPMPVAAANMYRFMTGHSPSSTFSRLAPDSEGTFDVPDRLHRQPGLPVLGHQTGPFTNGFLTVPKLIYNSNHVLSQTIQQSVELKRVLRQNISSNSVTRAVLQQAVQSTDNFSVQVNLTFDANTAVSDRAFLSGSFGRADPDLYYGIGGFAVPSLTLQLEGHREPLGGGLFKAVVTQATYHLVIRDLYDWDWEINPFGVLLQAGFLSYGAAGQNFVTEATVDGTLSDTVEVFFTP
jgi:hypothetical protein